ncbi:MAG: aminotransferase class I/II-fold pyridoxal phosphate-dependent enzyme, partial [Candidatus Marinimicrobia bacterium]|nr:aminotransferase class I/II-fold pyridoxal phosphate-dependent enzyme [Candidatus Neomarinimicrobiota bacterium]
TYFKLGNIEVAKIADIANRVSLCNISEEKKVNFHIGNPLDNSVLNGKHIDLILNGNSTEINIETKDFIRNSILTSVKYAPRGGYSSTNIQTFQKLIQKNIYEKDDKKYKYNLGEKNDRELIFASGGQYENLRTLLFGLNKYLKHERAHIIYYGKIFNNNILNYDNLNFTIINKNENKIISHLRKIILKKNEPNFIILEKTMSKNILKSLKDLSDEFPIFFIEINDSLGSNSLVSFPELRQNLIRFLLPNIFNSKYKNIAISIVVGNSSYINLLENIHFQLKGTPANTEMKLLEFLMTNNKKGETSFDKNSEKNIINDFFKNIDNSNWLEQLKYKFLKSFINHNPELDINNCIIVSGASRTALSLLGNLEQFKTIFTSDLSWTLEHVFEEVIFIPTNDDFTIDIDEIKNYIEKQLKIKKQIAVAFNNPHNATGKIIPESKIKTLISWLLQNSIFIIDDLAYKNLAPKNSLQITKTIKQIAIELSDEKIINKKKIEKLITVQSLSKTDCFAGARLSVVEIIDKKINKKFTEMVKKIQDNHTALLFAYLFYRNSKSDINSFFLERNKLFFENMKAIQKAIEDISIENNPFEISIEKPQGAMYPILTIKNLPEYISTEKLSKKLSKNGIGIVPFSIYARTNSTKAKSFRITIGGSATLDQLYNKTKILISNLTKNIQNFV